MLASEMKRRLVGGAHPTSLLGGSALHAFRYNYTIAEIEFSPTQHLTVSTIPRAVLDITAQASDARLDVWEL